MESAAADCPTIRFPALHEALARWWQILPALNQQVAADPGSEHPKLAGPYLARHGRRVA
jgi:hypothetical protein